MGCIVSSPVAEEDGHGDDEVGLQVERSQGTAMAPVERIFSLSLRHSARPKLEARSRELGLDGTCQSDPSEILQVRSRRTQRALFRRVAAACALARALLHTLALRPAARSSNDDRRGWRRVSNPRRRRYHRS